MTSMIFGASSSPFIAHTVRNQNAQEFKQSHPKAFKAITEAHYMDDYVASYHSKKEAMETICQVDFVHRQGKFILRAWTCNEPSVLEAVPKELQSNSSAHVLNGNQQHEKILGLLWDPKSDTLHFNTSLKRIAEEVRTLQRPPTKREALSTVMSIYDPLGLLSCFTITAKICLQSLWKLQVAWDEPIPQKPAEVFACWLQDLDRVAKLRIPRWYGESKVVNRQLHVFCDASEDAYAAAAYFRTEDEDQVVKIILVAAKSKVSPLKTQTIPRLELQAALIGTRLAETVKQEHHEKIDSVTYWTDARTVYYWIQNDKRKYTPYVAHRLGEITETTDPKQWRWLPTTLNVADLATRPGYVPHSDKDPWFNGPEFLKEDPSTWPMRLENAEPMEEHLVCEFQEESRDSSLPDVRRFSSYEKLIRTTARILLFIEKCRKRATKLNMELIEKAEGLWWRRSQQDSYATEINMIKKRQRLPKSSALWRLDPVLEDGLLVVRGRIDAANVPFETKRPVILDGRHPLTRLLVAFEHERAHHANNERVVNELRQRYWIINLRTTVRTVARTCQQCKIMKSQPITPAYGDLPKSRLQAFQRPFTHCGLDFFGPMLVKIGRRREKRWGALFTCLVTRAIHIELVPSLSTDSAIMTLRRMAARRGWPQVMWSDNATNFKGADRELKEAYETWLPELENYGLLKRMKWNFIAPGAPHQGGAWERLIRSVKVTLNTILKEKVPSEEVLQTLMCEVEHSVNSRPLTHVSVDHRDQEALTPNHFILGTSSGVPMTGTILRNEKRLWKTTQALADEFWRRWIKEYLPTLIPRGQACDQDRKNIQPGDLVVIVDPNSPRNFWPRGIVEKIRPGPDGVVRIADVRTQGGVFRRPVTKLAVLRVDPEIDSSIRTLPGPEGENALRVAIAPAAAENEELSVK